jgi:hypothetical protein
MMNKLGLGLLGKPMQPPRFGNLTLWLDPGVGIAATGGNIDSWTSRVGSGVLAQVGAARPMIDGSGRYIILSGTQTLTAAAAAANYPVAAAKITVCGWQYLTSAVNNQQLYVSGANNLVLQSQNDFAPLEAAAFVGGLGAVANSGSVQTLNAWAFVAYTFDGTLGAGSKSKLYYGLTPGGVAASGLFSDGVTASATPAASGNTTIGTNVNGKFGSLYVHSTVLTLAELQQLAALKVPS